MIDALKRAIERAAQQPESEQAALAYLLMQAMDADAKWDALLNSPASLTVLEHMAEEPHQEHVRGETRDLDEFVLDWHVR